MEYLSVVLQGLTERQLFSKYRKCEFWLRSVAFIGHIISSNGIKVDPKKNKMVKNWPRTLIQTDIRRLLDLVGYYSKFVDGFASISSPLTTLTQKIVKFYL